MRKTPLVPAVFFFAVALACWGCAPEPEAAPYSVELETYRVPHGFENEVRTMLRYTLGSGETEIGRADLAPGGTLVVVAPSGIQRGMRQFIDQLSSMDSVPPTPRPVSMTYWILVGRALERSPGDPGYSVAGKASLDEVGPALAAIAGSQGPMEFRLLERLQLASTGEESAELGGRLASVRQRATMVQEQVIADLEIQVRTRRQNSRLDTQVKLEPGQFVVLGNTGWAVEDSEDASAALFYVITSEVAL